MTQVKRFWGEPVLIWAVIQAATSMAESFGWLSGIGIHGQDALALLLVVENALAALHIAVVTHRTLLGPIVETFKALVSLGIIYGVHITTEQTGLVITLMTAIAGLIHQSQTSPLPPPNPDTGA